MFNYHYYTKQLIGELQPCIGLLLDHASRPRGILKPVKITQSVPYNLNLKKLRKSGILANLLKTKQTAGCAKQFERNGPFMNVVITWLQYHNLCHRLLYFCILVVREILVGCRFRVPVWQLQSATLVIDMPRLRNISETRFIKVNNYDIIKYEEVNDQNQYQSMNALVGEKHEFVQLKEHHVRTDL